MLEDHGLVFEEGMSSRSAEALEQVRDATDLTVLDGRGLGQHTLKSRRRGEEKERERTSQRERKREASKPKKVKDTRTRI